MRTLHLLAVLLLVACGDDASPGRDAGGTDTGLVDSAQPPIDAARDAAETDGGGDDAGTDGGAGSDAGTDAGVDADTSGAMLTVSLQTDGGFTGRGTNDYTLADGVLTVHRPFATPMDCMATLTPEQHGRLVTAARAVDWSMVMAMYIDPMNPTCCCDMFTYMLDVELVQPPGGSTGGSTRWCDETTGDLPADLTTFLGVLRAVGDEVEAGC